MSCTDFREKYFLVFSNIVHFSCYATSSEGFSLFKRNMVPRLQDLALNTGGRGGGVSFVVKVPREVPPAMVYFFGLLV